MQTDMAEIIANYVDSHTDDLSPLHQDLLAETEKITKRSFWSIGKVEGKLLQLLIKISNARRVVPTPHANAPVSLPNAAQAP